ncbi:tRNA lysidine(34) synthetase TilS [Leadbettera azotonutricia]|uniref:tRNA(Ile)-lysidine synthase n=1 Tax=Leadbettera azotonutricia (strain ATCC BAA-888 / DSM 13862 / ZAS-9) TaxID=545695 RepID=F5Y7C8_LEAAZ|nr:tRNA lysidine(34) synthetase TilS [Leadbettera azotonutricia]AEF82190.1 putative RNA methyltransferase [Leadbettera azotonutricia ZAS-9]
MNSFEAAVSAGLGDWPRGTVFIAAVSGGADSVSMLSALASLRQEKGFILHCVHVEHGMRAPDESLADAGAVEELCGKLDVACKVVSVGKGKVARAAWEKGIGVEAAARLYRHRILRREARLLKAERVLIAHTRDDLLETALMRMLKGSGPGGLAAMPRERGLILRPLLELGRKEVLAYLDEKNISYCTDSTNSDTKYLRNRIRLKLMPCMDDLFPSWRRGVEALGETQALAAGFLSSEASRRLEWKKDGGGLSMLAEKFLAEPLIIQEEAVFGAADLLAVRAAVPRRASLRRFLAGLPGGALASDLGPIRVEIRGNKLYAMPSDREKGEKGFSLLIKGPGSYNLKGWFTVEAGADGDTSMETGEGSVFFASYPLVLRPGRKDEAILKTRQKGRFQGTMECVAAEDCEGLAALIGAGKLLYGREEAPGYSKFIISGGIDVRRSER